MKTKIKFHTYGWFIAPYTGEMKIRARSSDDGQEIIIGVSRPIETKVSGDYIIHSYVA